MVPRLGFEPRLRDSESLVLPLDDLGVSRIHLFGPSWCRRLRADFNVGLTYVSAGPRRLLKLVSDKCILPSRLKAIREKDSGNSQIRQGRAEICWENSLTPACISGILSPTMKVTGQVVRGQGFATLAFNLPTANLEFEEVISLETGSYTAYAWVGKDRYKAIVYIGPRGSEKFEVHLFEFSGDLYDRPLTVEVLEQVSGHVAWESEEQMKQKVASDVAKARDYFATRSSSAS